MITPEEIQAIRGRPSKARKRKIEKLFDYLLEAYGSDIPSYYGKSLEVELEDLRGIYGEYWNIDQISTRHEPIYRFTPKPMEERPAKRGVFARLREALKVGRSQ
jgi:hypothetical protein